MNAVPTRGVQRKSRRKTRIRRHKKQLRTHSAATQLDENRVLLRKREVMQMTGLSQATIWRYTRRKNFPAPVYLSQNRSAYFADEIQAWLKTMRETRA
jgi:predicted DNA-binding transcriptional regulator AlpA